MKKQFLESIGYRWTTYEEIIGQIGTAPAGGWTINGTHDEYDETDFPAWTKCVAEYISNDDDYSLAGVVLVYDILSLDENGEER